MPEKTKMVFVRDVPEELWFRFKLTAAHNRLTVKDAFRQAILDWINTHAPQDRRIKNPLFK